MGGTGGRGCGWCAEEREEEAAGSGGVREGVEGCAEGGDCVDWEGHFGRWIGGCGLRCIRFGCAGLTVRGVSDWSIENGGSWGLCDCVPD